MQDFKIYPTKATLGILDFFLLLFCATTSFFVKVLSSLSKSGSFDDDENKSKSITHIIQVTNLQNIVACKDVMTLLSFQQSLVFSNEKSLLLRTVSFFCLLKTKFTIKTAFYFGFIFTFADAIFKM